MAISSFLSFVIISKDDDEGLRRTLTSIQELDKMLNQVDYGSIEVYCKFPVLTTTAESICRMAAASFRSFSLRIDPTPDSSIFDAMNIAAKGCLGKYIAFINSGDAIVPRSYFRVIDILSSTLDYDFVYGNTLWDKKVGLNRHFHSSICLPVIPWLLRLPAHQSLIVRTSLQRERPFDTRYPLSADTDFKLGILLSQNLRSIATSEPLSLCTAGGRSQIIDSPIDLWMRTYEVYKIHLKHFGGIGSVFIFIAFFLWNSRKIRFLKA